MGKKRRGEGGAQVVAERRHRAVPRREPEVPRGPDPERLERRDLAEEVAEAGAVGVEGLEVLEVDHPAELRQRPDQEDREGEQQRPDRELALERQPGREQRRQPDQARVAVGVDGADRDQRGRDEAQRQLAPARAPRRLPQGEDEGEDQECLHRLLEGALCEVGGDHVGEADEERRRGAAQRRLLGEGREGGQRGEDRDRDGEAVEALDEVDPEPLFESDGDRVRPERVALAQELRAGAVREPVGRQQVLGHVRVEAGAEDPEVAFDDERERSRRQRRQRHRSTRPKGLPAPRTRPHRKASGRRRKRDEDGGDRAVPGQPHRRPADRADQRQPDRRRQPGPAAHPAEPDRRLPDRQRGAAHGERCCVGPDHRRRA